ncbi:MAG: branched-chain amino acid aminotransferase [Rhodospirillaceae bacterium]|nr:branched-chain amino acid aminotransferase [Rhodospirillaceae bacterium]
MGIEIPVTRVERPKPRPLDDQLGFGQVFTDHMFLMDGAGDTGWSGPRIVPYGPLDLEPATVVLHYAQSVFEGLKAYRGHDDAVRLFRPARNIARFNRSAARLCVPPIDSDLFLAALRQLVGVDRDWVPRAPGTSLYIRPVAFARDPDLHVRPSRTYQFFIILSPVAAYYAEGFNPLRIRVEDRYARSVRGGTGAAKTAGNYAGSLLAGEEAQKDGFAQVLWLDGIQQRYIEEVGSMNIAFVIGDELVTPPVTGTLLEGVTRESVLQLARDYGMRVAERPVTIAELLTAARDGSLREAFGTGTAAVISPVGELAYKGERIRVQDGGAGPLSQRLFNDLSDIQRGRRPDRHGWMVPVED